MTSSPPSEEEEILAPGTTVGEYRVEGVLGQGGFGAVYRGVHPLIGKPAAIKVLKREFSAKAEMVSRFMAEARAVNEIRHRNIIDIFSFGQLPDGRHFYVMELLEGRTLDAHVKVRGKLPVPEALAILRPLARALGAAHQRGIAHRDLKPENVFITVDDEGRPLPKLLDFGIAKLASDFGAQHKTRSGVPMGTPAYMSPEQVHGKATDHRTDIYAFGVVTFEVLTGTLPFDGESMMDVLMKHVAEPPPRMSSRRGDIPRELDEAVLHMMEKDLGKRPQTILAAFDELVAGAVRAGLVSPQQFSPISTSGAGVTPASIPLVPDAAQNLYEAKTVVAEEPAPGASSASIIGATVAAQPPPRRRWLVAAAGAVVVAGAGAIYVALSPPAPAPPAPAAPFSAAPPATASQAAEIGSATSSVSVAPVASSTAPERKVRVTFEATPADAEVFLDGKRVGAVKEPVELDRGDEKVVLEIRRRGYVTNKAPVVPNADQKLKIDLAPAGAGPKPGELPGWNE